MGSWPPKNGRKERDANNSLKGGGMPKGGKVTNDGVVENVYCKMQKFVSQKLEWKNLLIQKYVQYQHFSS